VPISARLFDSAGEDREVDFADDSFTRLSGDEILWVDVISPEAADVERLGAAHDWHDETLADLTRTLGRARLRSYASYVHLTIEAIVCEAPLRSAEIDLLVGRDFVISVHADGVAALNGLGDEHRGDSRLGKLSAAEFMAMLVDRVLTGYHDCIEQIEQAIDRLDDQAMRSPEKDLLSPIIEIRRRIAFVRRTVAPHEAAFAPLARPDYGLHDELGQPWPGLIDRLRQAMAATESARESLFGSFDVLMARTGQRSNEAMQTLTVVSAMFLPAAVLAGVMGMNFELPLFEDPRAFWVVVGSMVGVALAILAVARAKGWI
jgi:magnesium transporter